MTDERKSYRGIIEDRRTAALDMAIGFWSGCDPESIARGAVEQTAESFLHFLSTGRSKFATPCASIVSIKRGK